MPKPEFLTAQFITSALTITIVMHILLAMAGLSIYFERKISAWMQDRYGPNRTGFDLGLPVLKSLFRGFGFWGLGQSLADGIKMLLKEDFTPRNADKALFMLAPALAVIPALLGFAIIPWGGTLAFPELTIPVLNWTIEAAEVTVAGANISIGIVYLLAVGAISIYAVALGSWASNNKYSFLGGMRAASQMLSYEIPMGLSILCVLLITGTLLPMAMVDHQSQHGWLIFSQPLACLIFGICVLAECNRAPFDNAECEAELVGGYHTEYSSMRFGLFFLAEYTHMATGAAIFAVMFLGGWHLSPFPGVFEIPGLRAEDTGILAALLKFGVLFGKVVLLIWLMMLIRWTLPRLRFDQVMQVGWQAVIPASMLLVLMNATIVYLGRTSLIEQLIANVLLGAAMFATVRMLPKSTKNKRIRLAGSRFSPLEGEVAVAGPQIDLAREDRPVEGSARLGAH